MTGTDSAGVAGYADATTTHVATGMTAGWYDLYGTFTVGDAGTLSIRFAQGASNATASNVFRIGSFLEIFRLP
jgi:hypothetical protein